MRRLPLGPIEAFVVVARTQSLTQAASAMNLTVPALSRRIQMLEQYLGVPLFRRLPRGLSLTEAGAVYFASLGPAWETIGRATEAVRQPVRRDTVRVSAMPIFAANWLMPRLYRFQQRHAGIEVELETSPDLVDLQLRPDLDCAIRLGEGPWPGTTAEPLLPVRACPVVSPSMFGPDASPASPGDLLRHTLIETGHQPAFWQAWFAATGVDGTGARYRRFDNLQVVYEAAANGMGIALGLEPLVGSHLESGRLRQLFPAIVRLPQGFHLVRRQDEPAPNQSFTWFRDWLLAEAASEPCMKLKAPGRELNGPGKTALVASR
jgi:LysR family transcriptional regulator, glycine cleavage system transcriptional activator